MRYSNSVFWLGKFPTLIACIFLSSSIAVQTQTTTTADPRVIVLVNGGNASVTWNVTATGLVDLEYSTDFSSWSTVSANNSSGSFIHAVGNAKKGFYRLRILPEIFLSGDLTFGNVVAGTSANRTLSITNTGKAALVVSDISYPAGFSGNWTGNIAPGASQNVTVTFAPVAAQSYGGNISVTSNASGGTSTLAASGIGVSTPVITSAASASGKVGDAFTYQITASNNPTSYSASGLHPGLTLNSTSGLISGTPTTAGDSEVTLSAINASGTGNATLAISILPQPPVITSAASTSGKVGDAFTYQITASNNPTSYSASGLPPGLTLNSTSGLISGTPTTAGDSEVTLSAINVGGTGKEATLAISILPQPPVITSILSANVLLGSAFSYQIIASGNPTTFDATDLPSGLSVDSNTGFISGTPGAAGNFSITLTASNIGGTSSAILELVVSDPMSNMIAYFPFSGNTTEERLANMSGSGTSNATLQTTYDWRYDLTGSLEFPSGVSVDGPTSGLAARLVGQAYLSVDPPVLSDGVTYHTISAWISFPLPDTSDWHTLASNPSTGNDHHVIVDGSGWIGVIANGNWQHSGFDVDNLATGWRHIAAVASEGQTKFYVDGVEVGTANAAVSVPVSRLGNTFAGWSNHWNAYSIGTFDGVRIFNRALNAAQIAQIYDQERPAISEISLLGNLTFGNVVAGTSDNRTLSITNTGKAALIVSGISYPAGFSGNWTGTISPGASQNVTVTFEPVAAESYSGNINVASNASGGTSTIAASGTGVSTPVITSAASVNVFLGNAFSYQITASGNPATFDATDLPSGLSVDSTTGLISGTPEAAGNFTITLKASNIGGIGNATLELVVSDPVTVMLAYYPFSGNANDTSGNNRHGTVENAVLTSNRFGVSDSAYEFSGNSRIVVPGPWLYGNSARTFVLWFKTPNQSQNANLLSMGSNEMDQRFSLLMGYGGTNKFGFVGESNDLDWDIGQVSDNQWHQLALSFNGTVSGDMTVYVDGASVGSKTPTWPLWTNGNKELVIGSNVVGRNNEFFIGGIDDVRIYDRALNAAQIAQIYQQEIAPPVITSATSASGTVGIPFSYQITASNNPTSFSASGLPAGLTVNSSNGLISGTPTAVGDSSVSLSASNAGGTGNATLTLSILPEPPVITSAASASGKVGDAFTYQITASNSPTSYSASGLPTGLTLNSTSGLISGTPTADGNSSVTLSASNAGGTGSATLTVSILPQPPVITSASTANGRVGQAFSYRIQASNSPSSFNASGLPAGLRLIDGSLIWGTPTTAGNASVTLSASNAAGTGNATLTISILPQPPVITSTASASGKVGDAFTYQITASNSPTSYSASGLPAGLILNSTSGLISGTPTADGNSSVTLSAINAGGTGSATLTFSILPRPPVISSAVSTSGTVGVPLSYQITASNNPTSFSAGGTASFRYFRFVPTALRSAGAGMVQLSEFQMLNNGVRLTGATASGPGGDNPEGESPAEANDNDVSTKWLDFNTQPLVLDFGSSKTVNGYRWATAGDEDGRDPVSWRVEASNDTINWSVLDQRSSQTITLNRNTYLGNFTLSSFGGLPSGLTLNTNTGVISGTPTTAGNSSVSISASNAGGTGYATLSISVLLQKPVITSATSASGTVRVPFIYQITASSSPTSFSASGLPAGLSLNSTSGVISGTPTAVGSFSVSLSASNAIGTGNATLTLSILPQIPVITSTASASGAVSVPFSYQITASYSPTSFSASGLPAGLTLNSTSGLISGTPTVAGNSSVTLSASNAEGAGNSTLELSIQATLPTLLISVPTSNSTSIDPFSMGKYEVTRAQWNQVVAAAKLRFVDYNFDEALQSWPLVFSPNGSSIAGWPKAVVTPVSSSGRNPLDLGHATTNSTVSRSFTVTNLSGESLSFSIVSKGKPDYPLYFTQPAIGVSINGSTNNDVASINMDHNTSFTLTVNFRPPYTDPSWYRANVEIKARDRYNTQTLAQTLTFIGQCTGSQANTADVSQHPMHSLSYTDAAKYCNALSELNGLTPVYKWPILNSATNKLLLRYNEGISSATQSVYRSGLWNGESHITGSADPVPDLVNANGYRLPTKEEWEWAMRGGSASSSTTYSGSNDATEVAWHRNNSTGSALPLFSTGLTGASGLLVDDDIIKYYMVANVGTFSIGQKIPNALGIYDLHGNVAEIIQGTNNAAATQALGGAWDSAADALNNTRPIYQTLNDVGGRGTGLRVVRSGQPVIRSMAYTANGVTTTSASGQVGVEFTPVYPIAKNVRSYTATGLPAGLSISTTTGHISGTPLNSGFSGLTRNFTANITLENASGTSAVFPFPISIKPTAPVLTLPSTPPDFILNSAEKTYTPPASNSPTQYTATGLPAGLTINTTTGLISGTPTSSGTFSVILTAENDGGTATGTLSLTVWKTPTAFDKPEFTFWNIQPAPWMRGVDQLSIAADTPATHSASLLSGNIGATVDSSAITSVAIKATPSPLFQGRQAKYKATATNPSGSHTANFTIFVEDGGFTPFGASTQSISGVAYNNLLNTFLQEFYQADSSDLYTRLAMGIGGALFAGSSNPPPATVPAFIIANTEVTVGEWLEVTENSPSYEFGSATYYSGGTNWQSRPIVGMSWFDALKFCNAKSELVGLTPAYRLNGTIYKQGYPAGNRTDSVTLDSTANGYRLPTAAEWLRAGTKNGQIYNNPNPVSNNADLNTQAYNDILSKAAPTHIVGFNSPANNNGIFDMAGSVWEWIWDSQYYDNTLGANTHYPALMGGSYKTPPATNKLNTFINVAAKYSANGGGYLDAGFRTVRNFPAPGIISSNSATGHAGQPFSYQITATNSNGPLANLTTYAATDLPSGLTLDTTKGLISGTPSAAGISTASITATNAGGTHTFTLAITITP